MSVFDDARSRVSIGLIESLCPGGTWRGGEYWVRSPLRDDSEPGSFHISEDGLFNDHARDGDHGDIIELVHRIRGGTLKDAAEWIVTSQGGTVQTARRGRPPRVEPRIPAPPESKPGLFALAKSSKRGTFAGGWWYHLADGGIAFAVIRFQGPDGKQVVPFYLGTDGTWHEGQPIADGRPLYHLPELVGSTLPVLVVEGEKCASVNVPGWVVVSWSSGASSVGKTDWTPLASAAEAGRRVVIWPDADEPGVKAARAVQGLVPQAEMLDILGRPDGWDIADAVADGIDPAAFIETCPRIVRDAPSVPTEAEHAGPFIALGSDGERHYFLRRGERVPYSINRGAFTASRILGLAPLAYWQALSMVTDADGIKVAPAQDYLQRLSLEAGRYNPDLLRGAGVWRDDGSIVVNDGRRIVPLDRPPEAFDEFRSRAVYLASDAVFGNLDGAAATDDEGSQLAALFEAQHFSRPVSAMLSLGWCLIAPYAGVLEWRPHVWISGRRGTGKSWVLDNLVRPLLGPFAYRGSGKDSEAGIRRTLQNDARPVVLDEMEPLDKRSIDRTMAILQLARNASSDASEYMTIAGSDGGTLRYRVRSCFCFASVQIPDTCAAIDSRVLRVELANVADQRGKIARSTSLLGVLLDPTRFLRRTFRALPRIIEDIAHIRTRLVGVVGDTRQIDNIAPLIAAAWSSISGESIQGEAGSSWLGRWLVELRDVAEDVVEDEDRVVQMILGHEILSDDKQSRTVAELIRIVRDEVGMVADGARDLLARFGLSLPRVKGKVVLAVSTSSQKIQAALKGSPYEAGYDAQFRRHRACLNPSDRGANVRMAGRVVRARLLDLEQFSEMYLGEGATDDAA